MTICIGAIAGKDHVVVASDRMVTLRVPSTEFEQRKSKTLQITDNCVAATAGSALAFTPIYTNTMTEVQTKNVREIRQIADIVRSQYVKMRNQKLEQEILGNIGINLQTFYQSNRALSPEIVANVVQSMAQYNYGLSILVAGVDTSGGHIYRIDNPGKMEVFDAIGHCAVGSGELHAISTFVANDYTSDLDLDHIVALTYEAKKRSEKAQGVGEQSDICIVCQNKTTKLPQELVTKLDRISNKRSEQEKKAVAEIEEEVKGLNIASIEKDGS